MATIFVLQFLIGRLRNRSRLRTLVDNSPTLLMLRGKVLHDRLDATRLTEADLQAAMRAANVHRYDDVDAVVLEKTGRLSVLHHSSPTDGLDARIVDGLAEVDGPIGAAHR